MSATTSTGRRRLADPAFRTLTRLTAVLVLGILIAIAVFLVVKAVPAVRADKSSFWSTFQWDPDNTQKFGIAVLAYASALSSVLALIMAFPVAIGVALFVVEYAPRRIGRTLGYLTDMLAAVPSVVYGLWGLLFLVPHLTGLQHYLARHLGFIPLFADPGGQTSVPSKSIFAASIVLAIMIIPIISAISREVFTQVDPSLREAAYALGATRWEMIRTAVLPPSRAGILGAVILGFGRALGETIAIALVLGSGFFLDEHILLPGRLETIAANIANQFAEAGPVGREALIASGLVLFVLTMIVALAARAVIYRAGAAERSVAV
jgi:phosphate transport system permease protein